MTSFEQILDRIFENPPRVHLGETEIRGDIVRNGSSLNECDLEVLVARRETCWGISRAVADLIARSVDENSFTLETGAGLSTLVFALRRSHHVCVTPHPKEFDALRSYGELFGITFANAICEGVVSEDYLPGCTLKTLDLVLIDGKHAFPWPIIDWFYTAHRLKVGGLLILDDVDLPAVRILNQFLKTDFNWRSVATLDNTHAYAKTTSDIRNIAWHYQRL